VPVSLSTDPELAAEIFAGLEERPRSIPTRLLYDSVGDDLFRRISASEDYYLTRCEHEILEQQSRSILDAFAPEGTLDVVELGAGDGHKSALLLEAALGGGREVFYVPIDISKAALTVLEQRMRERLPNLILRPTCGDYLSGLRELHAGTHRRELILFLGSNIGNYFDDEAVELLASVRAVIEPQDAMLVGFDLRKDPNLVHAAYNDRGGLTRRFNLNLLARLNRELGADFELDRFVHFEQYDPVQGIATSYLVSTDEQRVQLTGLGTTLELEAHEPIRTEISRKYSEDEIRRIAREAGFDVSALFHDRRRWFADALLRPS
jgi:dimethylhistidine N-methyltransferase